MERRVPGAAAARRRLLEFLRTEAAGGIVLGAAALAGILVANSPLAGTYQALLELPIALRAGEIGLSKPLVLWINDGLMAVFFLLVGLEIKREAIEGALSSRAKMALPALTALGGMIVPGAIYIAFNLGDRTALRGWAIPTATDIAFALGVIALLGRRVPAALKVQLTALAIIDDLGAILIIALFYTARLSALSLTLAGVAILVLCLLNRTGTVRLAPYLVTGVLLWVCVLNSGVHATLSGVVLAFAIPLGDSPGTGPLYRLEHALHGWVAFLILPVFAFANAGVPLAGVTPGNLLDPICVGIVVGLALGKPLGVMTAAFAAHRCGIGRLPEGVGWPQFFGMALLTGIGFTMSLFIGNLAFDDTLRETEVRLGVLAGSFCSAIAGLLVLRLVAPAARRRG